MKIVIDIEERDYRNIVKAVKFNDYPDVYTGRAIVNGTVLPEGHGDLISRSALIDKIEILDRRYGSDFYWETRRVVDSVPTVIEADKENRRHKAKWVYVQYDANPEIGNWHCSNCRCMPYYSNDIHTLKYCPECGYDMREDTDDKQ